MKWIRMALLCGLVGLATQGARADELIWAMASSGNGHLWQLDPTTNTSTLMGSLRDPVLNDVGPGWSTVAETPDKKLYFLRRLVNDVHVFSLDATNIITSGGIITNVQDVGSTGLGGNIDGLTAGPDGNLYITAYANSNISATTPAQNGLYRFNTTTGTNQFVGTFNGDTGPGGNNSFFTDLAFDPITGNLFGTGFQNGAYKIYSLNGTTALTDNGTSFDFNAAFDAVGIDGLAFNRITGAMYESSDTGGVFQVDRTSGTFLNYVSNSQGTEIGTDLAVQADTIPNITPEGSSLNMLLCGVVPFGALFMLRRRRTR